MYFLKKMIMVYPQCLLNFIELLYSQGAAHGNIVQTVLDILRKRDSPVPCFQSHPLTSLHERILPLKDTQKLRPISEVFFFFFCFYMFCLESLKASRRSGLKTEGSCHFFHFVACAWTWLHVRSVQTEVFFFFSDFHLRFFPIRSLYVCVCVFFLHPPFEWRHEAVP